MPDIKDQLTALGITGIPAKQEGYKVLAEFIREGERIEAAVAGEYDGKYGAAAATDQRVLFVGRSTGLFKKTSNEEYLYRHISSVEVDGGKVLGKVKIVVSGNAAVIDKVPNPAANAFATVVRRKVAEAGSTAPPAALVDVSAQLERLANLRERGVLTDAEFQEQKAKLLQ